MLRLMTFRQFLPASLVILLCVCLYSGCVYPQRTAIAFYACYQPGFSFAGKGPDFFVVEIENNRFFYRKQNVPNGSANLSGIPKIGLEGETLESIGFQDLTGDDVPEIILTFLSGKISGLRAYSVQNGSVVNLMSRGGHVGDSLWASGGFSVMLPPAYGELPEIWGWERAGDETGAHPPGSIKMASFWYAPTRHFWNGKQFIEKK